jgi:hypothetical protein
MMDIKFNVPLDPAQFNTNVPAGYEEQTMQVDTSDPTERDLVEMLALWAETTGGNFPSELTLEAAKELGQALGEKAELQAGEKPNLSHPAFKKWLQTFQKINRSLMFVRTLPAEADCHYAGAEVQFGDKTTPIFWYRPEGSATYRIIYADLSVLDVAPEDLPK